MYYLLAILFGLIVLFMLLLHLRPTRLPPVRGILHGQASSAHVCAAINNHALKADFLAGVRKREGRSAPIVYPEWIKECVTDSPVLLTPRLTNPYSKIGQGHK